MYKYNWYSWKILQEATFRRRMPSGAPVTKYTSGIHAPTPPSVPARNPAPGAVPAEPARLIETIIASKLQGLETPQP